MSDNSAHRIPACNMEAEILEKRWSLLCHNVDTSSVRSKHMMLRLIVYNTVNRYNLNPLTPKIWLLILPFSWETFPCN